MTARKLQSGRTRPFDKSDTALVLIDPQNDVLSERGANWDAVKASVQDNRTVDNIERLLRAAKERDYPVFISPHYFFPTDHEGHFDGPLESIEFSNNSFARKGPLTIDGFADSGADWLPRFKAYIDDGRTVVVRHQMI